MVSKKHGVGEGFIPSRVEQWFHRVGGDKLRPYETESIRLAPGSRKIPGFLLAAHIFNIIQGRTAAVRYINRGLQIQDFQITLQGSIQMLIIIFKPSLQK